MNKIMRGESGFTLVEVLVALAILAVFAIPIMGMFASSLSASKTSFSSTQAYTSANKIIEDMNDNQLFTNCTDVLIDDSEYSKYNINKNDFEVRKTVRPPTENNETVMESGIEPMELDEHKMLLTIDASIEGQLSFPDSARPTVYLDFGVTEKRIKFADALDSSDESDDDAILINDPDIYYIKIIYGESDFRLILDNKYDTDKVLYLINNYEQTDFKVDTIASSKGEWRIYEKSQDMSIDPSGSVSEAIITIKVTDRHTKREYSVTSSRVFYKYK